MLLTGWQFYLEGWAARHGVDVSPYRHRVALLPSRLASFMSAPECGFTGIGVVGPAVPAPGYAPGVYSYAWISGDFWRSTQSWLHEIGHNYFLRHASQPPAPTNPVRAPCARCCPRAGCACRGDARPCVTLRLVEPQGSRPGMLSG